MIGTSIYLQYHAQEKPSCFEGDNLEKLVELCDGIMVARGVSAIKFDLFPYSSFELSA